MILLMHFFCWLDEFYVFSLEQLSTINDKSDNSTAASVIKYPLCSKY